MSENMIFCTGEGKYESRGNGYQKNNMCFDKPVSDFSAAKKLVIELLEEFELTTFVKEENMTKEEKKENTEYKTIGGFLKVWDYKKAWEIFWRKIDSDTKKRFSELPNFDPDIFEQKTGIKIDEEASVSGTEVEVKYKGKTYKAIIQEENA